MNTAKYTLQGGVGAVVEHVRGGGVNGNGAGIGSGIGLLLADVELQGFKFIVRHNRNFLSKVKCYPFSYKHRGYIRPKRKFALTRVSK